MFQRAVALWSQHKDSISKINVASGGILPSAKGMNFNSLTHEDNGQMFIHK